MVAVQRAVDEPRLPRRVLPEEEDDRLCVKVRRTHQREDERVVLVRSATARILSTDTDHVSLEPVPRRDHLGLLHIQDRDFRSCPESHLFWTRSSESGCEWGGTPNGPHVPSIYGINRTILLLEFVNDP